jgi:hypothetical protein
VLKEYCWRFTLISEFEDEEEEEEEEEEATAVRGGRGERKFTNEMVGGWGRERGVVEIIIPIDVAPIIIAIIALSPLLFFSFLSSQQSCKKSSNYELQSFSSNKFGKVLFVCKLSATTLQAIKSSQKSPHLSFFSRTCQMLGVRTSSSCTGLSTFHTCQRRNSSSTKQGSFQSSSIS